MSSDSALLVIAGGAVPLPEPTIERLARAALDPVRLRADRGGCPAFIANGPAARLEAARRELAAAGVAATVLDAREASRLPPLEVAGGIASETGPLTLRVHGRPIGPPPGVPLLFVYGDVGRERAAPGAADARAGDTLKQRVLRAVCPVVDVVWNGGRVRVSARHMAWRGLPGATPSAPENFVRMIEALAAGSAGAVLDLGFAGQDVALETASPAREPVEGSDRERTALFDRYSSGSALAWEAGLFGSVAPGTLHAVGPGALPRAAGDPSRMLGPSRRTGRSPVPWIRAGADRRGSLRRVPAAWLGFGAALLLLFVWTSLARDPRLAAGALALSALALLPVGFSALSRRERLRAVPTAHVRSMAMGPVEVAGRVVATAAFTAPYSKTRCAWYRFEIEERTGGREPRGGFVSVDRGSSGDVPFRIEDGTGSVLVQPLGASVEVPPQVVALDADRRVREWTLAEGASVFVSGYGHRRSVAEGKPGGADRDDVFVGAGPDGFLTVSPRSHAEQARSLARRAALAFAASGLGLLLALALLAP